MDKDQAQNPRPLPHPSCLRVSPRRRPKAHYRPAVLHLLQVSQADVLIQLNHFVHPENVGHSVIREDDDIELVLQAPLLWVNRGSHDITHREGEGERGREREREGERGRERERSELLERSLIKRHFKTMCSRKKKHFPILNLIIYSHPPPPKITQLKIFAEGHGAAQSPSQQHTRASASQGACMLSSLALPPTVCGDVRAVTHPFHRCENKAQESF